MKHTIKLLLLALLAVTVLVLAGCSGEKDQYAINDEEGYTVSVQYHANGGQFATNAYTMTDSYKADGKTELMLLDPNDPARQEPFKAQRQGYFLAGWYTECTETGEKDALGNPVCTYSGYWDFAADTLPLEQGKAYTASEPVLHLYAAWVPNFTVEFCDKATGEVVETVAIDPTDPKQKELELSVWDENTGRLSKKDIPVKKGYTFNGLYLDAEGAKVEEASVLHSGVLDLETATATGANMKLYVDYMEGEFTAIYTAENLVDSLSSGDDVMIMADLDFTDIEWDYFIWGYEYNGTVLGNGHTLSNITLKIAPENVNNQEYPYAGLFGMLGETATVRDLTVKNMKLEICEGTMGLGQPNLQNIAIGPLAGQIAEGATVENVLFKDSEILLTRVIETYTYDLMLGTMEGITVTLTGEGSENFTTEIVDGLVEIVEIPQEETEEEETPEV